MWEDWVNTILGLWLLISGFIGGIVHNRTGSLINDLVIGALVIVFGILSAVKHRWAEWVNVAIGVWLIVVFLIPSVLTATWNNIVFGILIIGFGVWAALMRVETA